MMADFLKNFCSIGISFESDPFRLMFFLVSVFAFIITTLYSVKYMKNTKGNAVFYTFWGITFLSTAGIIFSADFFTLFMFFEIMSVSSSVWVFKTETEAADYAGRLYLRVSVLCGLVMLFGIMLTAKEFGTLSFAEITQKIAIADYDKNITLVAAILIFVGFGAKAGLFLLHVGLPRAYVEAPAHASAMLSAILTKTGIIGMMITGSVLGIVGNESFGEGLLVLACATMCAGAFMGIFSPNIKRVLAYSSVSQIGFVIAGIACLMYEKDNALAYSGTVLHMLNHTFIKLNLFMIAGIIYKNVGSLDLNEIKGYGRKQPLLLIPFLMSTLSLAGFPGTSGYISKTMLHEAIDEIAKTNQTASVVSIMFTITGGMTLCYMTKLFICLFIEKSKRETETKDTYLSVLSLIPSVPVIIMGFIPNLFCMIPEKCTLNEVETAGITGFNAYSFEAIKIALISFAIGIFLYLFFTRLLLIRNVKGKNKYINALPKWFDLEKYVYRPIIMIFIPFVFAFFARICDKIIDCISYFLRKTILGALKTKRHAAVGNDVTYGMGLFFDKIAAIRKKDTGESYTMKFAIGWDEVKELAKLIERGVSFSLLLFSTGLIATLLYMLF